MSDNNVIDYTTWRKGTVVRSWTYRKPDGTEGIGRTKIAVCPKCGRKGELICRAANPKSQHAGKWLVEVTHKGHVAMGMFLHVDDHCAVYVDDKPE